VGFSACTALKEASQRPPPTLEGGAGAGASSAEGGDGGPRTSSAGGEGGSIAGGNALTGQAGMTGGSHDGPEPDPPCSEAKPTTGTTYYACDCGAGADPDCTPGAEDATGTDPASPLRSLESLRQYFPLLEDGGAVALCRGGSFAVENDAPWMSPSCGETGCSIRDYTPPWARGDEPKPKIDAAGHDGLSLIASNYQIQILNLALSGGKTGVRIGRSDSVLLCGLSLGWFDVGVRLESEFDLQTSSGIRLSESSYSNIAGPAISSAGLTCDACSIVDNHFDSTGRDPEAG
jgi:hypothetical protein